MDGTAAYLELAAALGLGEQPLQVEPVEDLFGSPFRVTEAAVASAGVAVAAVAALDGVRGGRRPVASLDGRHAAAAFHSERLLRLRSAGDLELWDPLAGNYPAADGWIRLHTNLPHHRAAVLEVLGTSAERAEVEAAVVGWSTVALERAVVDAGGVAARMRTRAQYLAEPQRDAVLSRPVVDVTVAADAPVTTPSPLARGRVLDGVRVLDLSRVIAGPVAGRFLAAYGADVVRVDPPLDDGLLIEIETGFGKRRTTVDLRAADDRRRFEALVSGADVLFEGFRPGALAAVGYPDGRLRALAPGLVIGHLSAYGDRGPWGQRRGFDSVVQVATGLAHGCGFDPGAGPGKLPAQALDHATGYLLAAGLIEALRRRLQDGRGRTVHASLARTGEWLAGLGTQDRPAGSPPRESVAHLLEVWPDTAWGEVEHLRPLGVVGDRPARWSRPPTPRTAAAVSWLDRR